MSEIDSGELLSLDLVFARCKLVVLISPEESLIGGGDDLDKKITFT